MRCAYSACVNGATVCVEIYLILISIYIQSIILSSIIMIEGGVGVLPKNKKKLLYSYKMMPY